MTSPKTALLMSSSDPNDPVASDVWANVAGNRLLRVNRAGRGRQYETGVSTPGGFDADLLNIDEYMNRANSVSPLLANTELMRRVRWMAMHPADGAGNLINMTNMRADPSFESYNVGFSPPWLWFYGALPAVTATGPHSGTRAVAQTITAGAGLQGVVVEMEFIPGEVYVASVWINQTAANTAILAINGHLSTPMASTTATGYTRISGIFQADQPSLQVVVVNQAPTLSGTITYDEIQVEVAQVLNPDPDFAGTVASWVGSGATVARSGLTLDRTGSLKVTPTGVSANVQAWGGSIPATAGLRYAILGAINPAAGATSAIRLGIDWYNASNVNFNTSAITQTPPAGVWTRYPLTMFTAPATTAAGKVLTYMTGTPPVTATWLLSGPMMFLAEPSAFTTSGPRVRSLWGGHAERLPITWDSVGNGGTARLTAVGPLAALAGIGMSTDWAGVLADKAPDLSWPLWDGSNATAWAETSGNNGPALTRVDSSYGAAPSFSSGSSMGVPGDPGGTGVAIGSNLGINPTASTVLGAGRVAVGARPVAVGSSTLPFGVTLSIWAKWSPMSTSFTSYLMAMFDDAGKVAFSIYFDSTAAGLLQILGYWEFLGPSLNMKAFSPDRRDLSDGKPHLITAVMSAGSAVANVFLYVDGVLQGTSPTRNPTTDNWPMPLIFSNIQIGGAIVPFNAGGSFPGPKDAVYEGANIWNRALSSQDVTDLWNAGQGYPGETPGARLGRFFNRYYVGPTVLDTGTSKLNPSGVTSGTKLQQAAQRVVESAYGDLFENRKAALEFDDRSTRFLNTVSQGVFGENAAGGEIPYSGAPTFGYDLTQVNNQAVVSQTGGTKATASDLASIRSLYQRSISVQTDTQNPLEAFDFANWLVSNLKRPKQRVERIILDPGANPTIWGTVLDLEKGQRWTLVRRAKSANAGAGVTMSGDYFIENINHRQVDFEKGSWLVDLILSPVQLQPWILGDSTYGQLGITTIAGF